jgi:subtilisin family serine protease
VRVIVEIQLPLAGTGGISALGPTRRRNAARSLLEDAVGRVGGEVDADFDVHALRLRPRPPGLMGRLEVAIGSRHLVGSVAGGPKDRRETWLGRADLQSFEKVPYVVKEQDHVVGIYTDPVVAAMTAPCCSDDAVGDENDVRALMGLGSLEAEGLTGSGVDVAVVDTGFSLEAIRNQGRTCPFNPLPGATWGVPGAAGPGQHPCDDLHEHGTMCAYEVGIAAPDAMLHDMGFLGSQPTLKAQLSDAVLCYEELLRHATSSNAPLVVTNSWGLVDPTEDMAAPQDARYLDNPAHAFNLAVASLEAAGVDVVFAAGNCGGDCPSEQCRGGGVICGANAMPCVLTVGGVSTLGDVAGYSTHGPGTIVEEKPDVCAYCHFAGFFSPDPDEGTSAAAPLVAGLIAAIRSRWKPADLSPAVLRELIRLTAHHSPAVYRTDAGWGIVNAERLMRSINRVLAGKP